MEEKKLNFFQKVARSLYSVKTYSIFNKLSVGKAFGYLLLLTVTLGILSSISPVIAYNQAIGYISKEFVAKVPAFELKDGIFTMEGKMPVRYESGGTVIVIDTTGKTTVDSLQAYSSYLLITKTAYFQKQNLREQIYKFKDLAALTFTKDSVQKMIPLLNLVSIFIVLFVPVGFFVVYLFFALLLALIGLILNSAVGSRLPFGNIFKLGIYALTLPTIFEVIFNAFSFNIPYFWLIKLLVATIILWAAFAEIKNEREEQEAMPEPPLAP
ncbi:MAG: DUF1189 domain-containing protein [Clostridia bacterium]